MVLSFVIQREQELPYTYLDYGISPFVGRIQYYQPVVKFKGAVVYLMSQQPILAFLSWFHTDRWNGNERTDIILQTSSWSPELKGSLDRSDLPGWAEKVRILGIHRYISGTRFLTIAAL